MSLTLGFETSTSIYTSYLSLSIAKRWRSIAFGNLYASVCVWNVRNNLLLVKSVFLASWRNWRIEFIIQLERSLLLLRLLIQLKDLAFVSTYPIRRTKRSLSWVCVWIHLGLSPGLLQRWQFLSVFWLFFIFFLHFKRISVLVSGCSLVIYCNGICITSEFDISMRPNEQFLAYSCDIEQC